MKKGYEFIVLDERGNKQSVFRVKRANGKKPFTIPTNTTERRGFTFGECFERAWQNMFT